MYTLLRNSFSVSDIAGGAAKVLEFGLLALLIYGVIYFIRGTRAVCVLAGTVLLLICVTLLSRELNLEVMHWLLTHLWTVFSMVLVVIFQPELRRALAQLGTFLSYKQNTVKIQTVSEIVNAVEQLSSTKTGALMVFERKIGLASFRSTAIRIEAKVSSPILRSIFYPNSPLHDGAVIIIGDTITAAHAILPIHRRPEFIQMHLGTRHCAAISVTEETDALAIVVSEETGGISVASRGNLQRHLTLKELELLMSEELLDKKSVESEA